MILSQGYSHFRRFVNSQILFFHTRNTSVTGPSRCRLDGTFFCHSRLTNCLRKFVFLHAQYIRCRLSRCPTLWIFVVSSEHHQGGCLVFDFVEFDRFCVSRFVSLLLFASNRDTRHMLLYVRIHTCCRLTRGKGNTEHGTRNKVYQKRTKHEKTWKIQKPDQKIG